KPGMPAPGSAAAAAGAGAAAAAGAAAQAAGAGAPAAQAGAARPPSPPKPASPAPRAERPPTSVLPPRRDASPSVRRIGGTAEANRALNPTAVEPPPSPPRNPVYIALAVAGVLVLGAGAAIGVPKLVSGGGSSSTT